MECFQVKPFPLNWFFFIKTKTRRVFEVCLLVFGMTKKRFSHGESQANPYITRNKHPKVPPQNRPKLGLTGWKSSASRGCNNIAQCVCWAFFSVARPTKYTQDFLKTLSPLQGLIMRTTLEIKFIVLLNFFLPQMMIEFKLNLNLNF